MRSDSGHTQSAWMDTADVPQFPALMEDAIADVCVIGAGIAGMMTAYYLVREGRSVIVIDDGPIAGGETGRTTAHLSNAFDDRYTAIEKMHGSLAARLTAESHTAAIDALEEVVKTENIDCDFRRVDGWLFLSEDDRRHRPDTLERQPGDSPQLHYAASEVGNSFHLHRQPADAHAVPRRTMRVVERRRRQARGHCRQRLD